ncbi:MAG: aldehyde dehydrogenase [Cellvibrionaceae bacterium]|nr:aldehyde dehydrogenase [Cellvibrionaceae bacterium]|tara:strand:- start:29055 stop:30395 length:1341 start_codon:yes stop_codon:yes gene_type:complete
MSEAVDTQTQTEIQRIFELQRSNRLNLKCSTAEQRKAKLQKLRDVIVARADEIDDALFQDMRKQRLGIEHYEIQSALGEIDVALAGLEDWMKPEAVEPTPQLGGKKTYIQYEPRGVCLLFGPWNFPFSLVFAPLVQIIAAGNACIVKPNEMQPIVSKVSASIIREVFDEQDVAVLEGGVPLADALLELPVDHIFFTGSPAVGKRIMAAAAKNLTSVTLELGGKCPMIVDDGCDPMQAAGMAIGGRFRNAGQLCLSVDHVWVPEAMLDTFVPIASAVVDKMFYVDGELNKAELSRMVDNRNFHRVKAHLDDAVARGAKVVKGGQLEEDDLTIHPTLLVNVPLDSSIMQDEIFGPLLPILTYKNRDEIYQQIDATGKPLAMYIFSPNDEFVEDVLLNTSSGGVTVNSMMMHYMEKNLPFGGANQSGIGRCKGIFGFKELSNARSVFEA